MAIGAAVSGVGYLTSGNLYFLAEPCCGAHCRCTEACANVGSDSGWFKRRVALTSLVASDIKAYGRRR